MKLTISKGLLLSLLASMAVQAEPFIAQEIIPVDADTALTVEWKQTLEQPLMDGSTNTTPKAVVKDGAGTLTVTEDLVLNNPLVVREGTLSVTGSTITSMIKNPLTSYVPYLSVGGNNATLELKDSTISHTIKGTNNYSIALTLGTADGAATVNMDNSTLHTDHFIFAGYNGAGRDTQDYMKYTTDTAGNRYSNGDGSTLTVINLNNGSELTAGTSLQFANVEVNISDSRLADHTREDNPAKSWTYLGVYDDSKTTINVTNGGSLDLQQYTLLAYGNNSETAITVSGKNEQGERSTANISNTAYTDYYETGKTKFTLTVEEGAAANVDTLVLSNNATVSVDESSELNVIDGAIDGLVYVENGASVTNKGSIGAGISLEGGELTAYENSSLAEVTAIAGTFNILGDISMTGDLVMDGDAMLIFGSSDYTIDLGDNEFIFNSGSIALTLSDNDISNVVLFKSTATGADYSGMQVTLLDGEGNTTGTATLSYNVDGTVTLNAAAVPEPTTATLSLLALAALAARRRRK